MDCKTCKHATALFTCERDSRFEATYKPSGYVRCRKPGYRGRVYFVRDGKPACGEYEKRERAGR
jgi:hypothetical protein